MTLSINFDCNDFCSLRYDDDDYNQFAPRDPWADLPTKHSSAPFNSMVKPVGGN